MVDQIVIQIDGAGGIILCRRGEARWHFPEENWDLDTGTQDSNRAVIGNEHVGTLTIELYKYTVFGTSNNPRAASSLI
jgi:hypothetical protein